MNEFEIYIDDQFVCSQNSDGLIIATPYRLNRLCTLWRRPDSASASGCHCAGPHVPAHTEHATIVIEGNQRIRVVITPNNAHAPRLTCDSQGFINTPPGTHIIIEKKPQRLHLVHPLDYSYYETLRSKLHWGHKLQYKD